MRASASSMVAARAWWASFSTRGSSVLAKYKLTDLGTLKVQSSKARTQKQETKKWDLGYDPNKPLKDQPLQEKFATVVRRIERLRDRNQPLTGPLRRISDLCSVEGFSTCFSALKMFPRVMLLSLSAEGAISQGC